MLSVLLLAAAAPADPPRQCRQLHYAADGAVTETRVADPGTVTVRSEGGGSAQSSVSASSRGGRSQSRSSSSTTTSDGRHRSVTITRDDKGCTIVIDERPPPRR